jgi:alpha-glutamyl/putrescinyl thymine pyrophosphorylase-like protein
VSVTWPSRQNKLAHLAAALDEFSKTQYPLLGIKQAAARNTLAMQMIASLRRLDYTRIIKGRSIDPERADPSSPMFDPERAAILHAKDGCIDEAIWLIFLATHFGKHGLFGWRRMRDVYSALGQERWTWAKVSENPARFESWMRLNYERIGGAFGNHRKYESVRPDSANGTMVVIKSFIDCVEGAPSRWFADLIKRTGNDPHKIFDAAYYELKVARFGRLAKFDFLALIGRLDLAPITPGSTYLRDATGPLKGARLLVDGDVKSATRAEELEDVLRLLDEKLNVGMQVTEDSICNWQKSPTKFKHFKG